MRVYRSGLPVSLISFLLSAFALYAFVVGAQTETPAAQETKPAAPPTERLPAIEPDAGYHQHHDEPHNAFP